MVSKISGEFNGVETKQEKMTIKNLPKNLNHRTPLINIQEKRKIISEQYCFLK